MSGIPASIGRYRVERMLGQGAMGSVYLGRDLELDRPVAIKTVRHLDLEAKRLSTFLERFKNEARAAARLSHPAIVAVYDVGEDPSVGPYLVFEYVAGSTLKQIIRGRGRIPPVDVVRLGRQLASALDTAHAAGVIHRDIKPDNILMSASGDAKLADFGVARVPDAALTKEGQFLGTPCYAAPETLDSAQYGAHSDLFSFAAVLYEAISAERAFPGDDAISVAHRVVHDEPEAPSAVAKDAGIPKEVDRVVMRGLSKDPVERYDSAQELVEALRLAYVAAGIIDDDSTGAHLLPSVERMPTPKGGSWAFGMVLAGGLAVGVALVALLGDWSAGQTVDADAGLPFEDEADAGPRTVTSDPVVVVPVEEDAGPAEIDAGPPDAGAEDLVEDAGIASLSGFEREEAAKDQVRLARERLAAGDLDGAEAAVARARLYDADNGDLPGLARQIDALRGADGPAVP